MPLPEPSWTIGPWRKAVAISDDALALWPGMPEHETNADGRWLRLVAGARVVYLQRYAWDEATRPDYVVSWHVVGAQAEQSRFGSFADAVAAVRTLVEGQVFALVPPPDWLTTRSVASTGGDAFVIAEGQPAATISA